MLSQAVLCGRCRLQRKTAPYGVQTFASAVCDLRAMLAAKSLSLQRAVLPPAGRARALHSGGEGTVQPFQFPTSQELTQVVTADFTGVALEERHETPSTGLETEYLMTLYVPLERPLSAADNLKIWNIRSQGSWLSGPGIKAKIVNPAGDWARVLPGGQIRVDVRLTLETEDGQIISMSYNGIVQVNADALPRLMRGEMITAQDAYFVIAPTFETRSEKYSWLNGLQAVGKMISFKRGEDSHVQYEIFRVR